jgi:hypothetical protein
MLEKKIRQIIVGNYVTKGIRKLDSCFSDVKIVGLDTETINGRLFTIQLDSDEICEFKIAEDMNEQERLDWLFEVVGKGSTVFFVHNLEFDLGVLFPDICLKLPTAKYGYRMHVLYGHPNYMSVNNDVHGKNFKSIQFMDTLAFFKGSLKSQAERMHLPMQKLEHPKCVLENRRPTKEEFVYFKEYAMQDARVTFFMGKEIVRMHREFNVPVKGTVSPATMASKIYRSCYLKNEIPFQPRMISRLGLLSYNGGRTESCVYGTTKCNVYDFNSAYPYALTQIPVPLEKKWKKVDDFSGEEGFYRISGEIPLKKVSPLPFKTERLIFPVGRFRNLVVTGYEMRNIVEVAKLNKVQGWIYCGESDDSWRNYVLDFYAKKNASKGQPVEYHFNKLMMNSPYGKLLQLNPLDGEAKSKWIFFFNQKTNSLSELPLEPRFQAAGMFNPVMASWVTGFTRAMLYDKLNNYEDDVLYCDTDSVCVRARTKIPSSDRLGDLKFETNGEATILREKLYMIRKDKEIIKTALHGFWGSQDELFKIIVRGETKYKISHMNKLKEAFTQGKTPFTFETQDRVIDLSPSMKRQIPEGLDKFDFLNDCIELKPITLGKDTS